MLIFLCLILLLQLLTKCLDLRLEGNNLAILLREVFRYTFYLLHHLRPLLREGRALCLQRRAVARMQVIVVLLEFAEVLLELLDLLIG